MSLRSLRDENPKRPNSRAEVRILTPMLREAQLPRGPPFSRSPRQGGMSSGPAVKPDQTNNNLAPPRWVVNPCPRARTWQRVTEIFLTDGWEERGPGDGATWAADTLEANLRRESLRVWEVASGGPAEGRHAGAANDGRLSRGLDGSATSRVIPAAAASEDSSEVRKASGCPSVETAGAPPPPAPAVATAHG